MGTAIGCHAAQGASVHQTSVHRQSTAGWRCSLASRALSSKILPLGIKARRYLTKVTNQPVLSLGWLVTFVKYYATAYLSAI